MQLFPLNCFLHAQYACNHHIIHHVYCLFAVVEPPALADILSVGSGSGAVTVDGTGPHLLAAGTLGYINVCGDSIIYLCMCAQESVRIILRASYGHWR